MRRTVRQKRSKEKALALQDSDQTVPPTDTRAAIIQALIPIVLAHVVEQLTAEVIAAAGARYQRGDHAPSCVRWGSQPGSVYLGEQKVPLQVPRVRDRASN